MAAPDERAVNTLLRTYWSSAGWRDEPTTKPEELAHAVEAGVMFDGTLTALHDDIVAGVLEAVAAVSRHEVAHVFLASLTSRRLDLRSALGSYAIAQHVAAHSFEPVSGDIAFGCAVCGLMEVEPDIDRNVLNFERFKWGGVRRDDLTYVWLDLRQFNLADRPRPIPADHSLFEELLTELETACGHHGGQGRAGVAPRP